MDQPNRPSGKSYSDVMNEWAAQRNFVNESRSRLIHPPYDAHPVVKLFGYLWRLVVLALIPAAGYLFLLSNYVKSGDFGKQLSKGLAVTLNAETAEAKMASWKFDGMLSIRHLEATGGKNSFYERLEIKGASTRIPLPQLFHREWNLRRVSLGELSLALRSGGLGAVPLYQTDEADILPSLPGEKEPAADTPKTGMRSAPRSQPQVITAGLGINPDFSNLSIQSIQAGVLHATWGTGLATAGAVTGMQTDITRSTEGWVISGNGGDFRQGWLTGFKMEKLAVDLHSDTAFIRQASLKSHSGGQGTLKGEIKLGEVPEIAAELKLEDLQLQDLVSPEAGGLFQAQGSGLIRLTGSVNRLTGVRMQGTMNLNSGRISALPVLKALHKITGEEQFRLLSVRSGKVEFTSGGAEDHGGQLIEIKSIEADCGPLVRISGSYRQELIRAREDLTGVEAVDRTKISGVIRLSLSSQVVAKIKPAIVSAFLKPGDEGWSWLEFPIEGPVTNSLGSELAQRLFEADNASGN